jgi:hypothetical protein
MTSTYLQDLVGTAACTTTTVKEKQMKAENPAQGILKLNNWGESVWYYVPCECTDPNHAHTIEVEADDNSVSVHIHTQVKTRFWQKNRWSEIWNILTKGYSEYEASVILTEQQAINYANALTSAVNDVKIYKDKRNKK